MTGTIISRRLVASWKLPKFTGPINPISIRQLHILRNPLLRFGNGAPKVAAPHAELDRDIALVALVKNIGCTRIQGYVGKLSQRNIGISAAGLIADLDISHRIDIAAKFGRQANGKVELTVRFQDSSRCRAAQSRLYDGI